MRIICTIKHYKQARKDCDEKNPVALALVEALGVKEVSVNQYGIATLPGGLRYVVMGACELLFYWRNSEPYIPGWMEVEDYPDDG